MSLETNKEVLAETPGVAEVQEVKAKKKKPFYLQTKFLVALGIFLLASAEIYAQDHTQAQSTIGTTAGEIKNYATNVTKVVQAVGGIVGLIGAGRIYNKWTNGDQDINKEIVAWAGAAIFLMVAPSVITGFFG